MGENFLQKDRFFVGGHMTETPTTMTYTSVVLRYLVRIMLNIEALNGFNIFSWDIHNAYLTAECQVKIGLMLVQSLALILEKLQL